MRTASERRAAGEAPFCDCGQCVSNAAVELRGVAMVAAWRMFDIERDQLAALLRALVVQTLLDPATWARPEGWRP